MRIALLAALVAGVCLLFPVWTTAQEGPIGVETLLREMIDLDRLSRLPASPYRVVQVSSYDRRSREFGGPHWFANSDGFGNEPIPNVEAVLEEAGEDRVGRYLLARFDVPGAIVRTWTAQMNGEITLWIDDSETPLFRGPANAFLRELYPALAREADLADSGYGDAMTQLDAGYYPIPFAKSCRIEWTGRLDQLHFYHIEFRLYEPGVAVEPFDVAALARHGDTIAEVQDILRRPSLLDEREVRGVVAERELDLPPGAAEDVLTLSDQSGEVRSLRFKVDAAHLNKALRQTVLTIAFDDYSQPQVEAPLGDFFGAAPGVNPFDSIPMTVQPDGWMICRFPMPFARSLRVRLHNRSDAPVRVQSAIETADRPWTDRDMRFFARWRVNHEMQVRGGVGIDMPYILVNGQGRFVGCAALLFNPSTAPHPHGSWWGEGDEKIFVDDDAFPSFFGTGSEDYFNYSWSRPDLFSYAYWAQPRNDGPGNCGFVTNNRWHILDDILFQERLAFYMEMLHHSTTDHFSYARAAYYYARPGAYDDHVPLFREDLRELAMPADWAPAALGAAVNGRFVQMEDLGGAAGLVAEGPQWSRGKILAWSPKQEGDTLDLTLEVEEAGNYQIQFIMVMNPGSGRFAVKLNGEYLPAGAEEPWVGDLYTPFHTMLYTMGPSQPVALEAGEHTLTLVSQGSNAASRGAFIGGDFIWLQPR